MFLSFTTLPNLFVVTKGLLSERQKGKTLQQGVSLFAVPGNLTLVLYVFTSFVNNKNEPLNFIIELFFHL